MKRIVVCIRQGLDGDISPFDASAYEAALRFKDAEITLLSMASLSAKDFLLSLTRLGAKKAILLNDKSFAGADTLATAYTLSLAVKKLAPDLVICGRQTLIGDTGQTGAMLAAFLDMPLVTNVMGVDELDNGELLIATRSEGQTTVKAPALLCVERIYTLRLPRLRSKLGEVEILCANDIGADTARCGLVGSPTRVIESFENKSGKRRCRFVSRKELSGIIDKALQQTAENTNAMLKSQERLSGVCIVGEAPRAFAESVSDSVTLIPLTDVNDIIEKIKGSLS